MHRNLLSIRNFIGNATRYFASDAAAVLKSTRLPPKKPAGWTMPEKTAYIDGICMEGAKNSAAGFGVFWGEDHANNTYGSVEGAQTSNRAGFVAMIEAVKQALNKGEKELTVRTDNDFLYGCMTRWVSGWKENGWKKKDGQEVKLKDLIQELDDLSAKLDVKYELIETLEQSDFGHDSANRLAIEGAKVAMAERGNNAKASTPKQAGKASNSKESGSGAKFVAAIETVKQALDNGQKEVTVRTESDHLYKSMTRWVSGWKKNGWKRTDGEEVKHKDLIQELDDLSAKLEVKYELIETLEQSDFGHDSANRLAIEGAKVAMAERGVDAKASTPMKAANESNSKERGPRPKLVAAIETIKQAIDKGQKEVTVLTESDFLYKSMTRWVSGWKANGWKKSDGQEVAHKDLIQELDDLSAKLDVKYEMIARNKEPKPKESSPREKLTAAIETVKQALANGQKEVTVQTESVFLYKSMTRWISGWKVNGWKKKDGQEVVNKDLIQELDDLSTKLHVKYELVEKTKKSEE